MRKGKVGIIGNRDGRKSLEYRKVQKRLEDDTLSIASLS